MAGLDGHTQPCRTLRTRHSQVDGQQSELAHGQMDSYQLCATFQNIQSQATKMEEIQSSTMMKKSVRCATILELYRDTFREG